MPPRKKLQIRSLSWLTLLGVVAALLGVVQTVIVAMIFGATRAVEVFFAAITFQTFLIQLSSSGQVGEIFTPLFHDIQDEHGQTAAREAFASMMNVMVLIAGATSVLGMLAAFPIASILVPGFSSIDTDLTAKVFLCTAPLIIVHVVSGMFNNLLDAEHQYFANEIFTTIARVSNLLVVVVFGWTLGVWALILGLWAGAITRLFCQLVYTFKQGYRHRFWLRTPSFRPQLVLLKIPFTLLHILSAQFYAFALTAGLSFLPEGSYAVFGYAQRMHAKIQGIVLKPIGVVFFNRFSQSLAQRSDRLVDYAHHALSLSMATVSLAVVSLVSAGDLLLKGLWGSERFPDDRIYLCYLLLVTFAVLSLVDAQTLVTRRTNLALKVVGRQYSASGVVFLLSAIACYWIIPAYGVWGAMGICGFVTFASAAVALLVLFFVRSDLVAIIPVLPLGQWVIAGTLATTVAHGVRHLLSIDLSASRPMILLATCVVGGVSVSVCFVASWLLRTVETVEFASRVREKLSRQTTQKLPPA